MEFFLSGFSFTNIYDSQDGQEEDVPLTPLYHFFPLDRNLDISVAIIAELAARRKAGTFGFQAQVVIIFWYCFKTGSYK